MIFTKTKIGGLEIIDLEPHQDERGFFARTWDEKESEARGLSLHIVQCNISFNTSAGTMRGMHYQAAPHAEIKVVRCTRGALYDVVIDLRLDSPSYKQWVALELSAENHRALYIPEGCAHGFQTLLDDTEVSYLMSSYFNAASARGVRFDDPAFAIEWPRVAHRIISDKDRSYPDWKI